MKKHHILLILLVAGIAAFFLNEARVTGNTETNVKAELAMLRDAVRKSPGPDVSSFSSKSSNSRSSFIDPQVFVADLAAILKSGQEGDIRELMNGLQERYHKQLASAPLSKLKEICDLIEKEFPLGQEGSKLAGNLWLYVVGMAAKSDPAWAIAKLEQGISAAKAPVGDMLRTLKRWASQDGQPMSLSYATALQKWLDAAQADGRIEPNDPVVAELRAEVATAQGNQSAAVQQLSKLPYLNQQRAAIDYAATLQTPEAQRQAMEELSHALHIQNFPRFVRELTGQQGYDAARQVLDSASLAPEKYDLAAASIAASNIGAGTPAKAKWLLESLRSEDTRAIREFADQWTHADYQGAAQWLGSLPGGKQRDIAISGFAPVAAKIDGASAVDWALAITDPDLRRSSLDDVVRKWKEADPEAATAYLRIKQIDIK